MHTTSSVDTRGPISVKNAGRVATHTLVIGEPRPLIRSFMAGALANAETLNVEAEAETLDDLRALALERSPRLAIVSGAFGAKQVFDAMRDLARDLPDTALAFFAIDARDHFVASAVDAGASAYITAIETASSLVRALNTVADGHTYFSQDVQERLAPPPRSDGFTEVKMRPRLALLTPREVEVLTCIAQALSKKEIAKQLNRSPKTIDNHTTNLMNKLDIHDRVELTLFAIREGLATP